MSLAAAFPAAGSAAEDSAVVSVYVDGEKQVVSTDAGTVTAVLRRAGITVDANDLVEPAPETEITNRIFNINVYRARPVILVDEENEYRIESPYQSPRLIAENSGIVEVYEEDRLHAELVRTGIVQTDHIGYRVIIDRATPLKLTLAGETMVVRTQAETVGEMLAEKDIALSEDDHLNVPAGTQIHAGMHVKLLKVGQHTISEPETIARPVEYIFDNNRPLDYEEVRQEGKDGVAMVTFELTLHDGVEVKRHRLNRVVVEEPRVRVVVQGRQLALDQAFADLRFCEAGGNYAANTGNGYYGAYQFNIGTWGSYASAAHAGTRPDLAPPAAQDQAALALYNARGWTPWPGCRAKLGLP